MARQMQVYFIHGRWHGELPSFPRDPGATGAFDAFMGRHSHPGREEMKADLVERLDGLLYIYI